MEQPRQAVYNADGTVFNRTGIGTLMLPAFYRDNPHGRNIGALATPSTSGGPLAFITSATSTYRSMRLVPNPYLEIGSAFMSLFYRPSTKYFLPRMAASDGRVVLQMDDGSWCTVQNLAALNVINTEGFFTPTSRDDVPKATLPYCPYPNGFYKMSSSNSNNIYYLGYNAPNSRAPQYFYNIKFSTGYCLLTSIDQWTHFVTDMLGVQPNFAAINATHFEIGSDGNFAEGRQFLGNCVNNRFDNNSDVGWSPTISMPAWLANPSSGVDHLRRILFNGGDRLINELNAMSDDNVRNTVIVTLVNDTAGNANYYAGLDNNNLAGIAGLRLYVKGAGASTATTSPDNIRNTAIVIMANRGRGTTEQFAAMNNFDLYKAAFG